MLGSTIHDTEASPPPTAHEVKDTARRASYNSSTRPCRALHGAGWDFRANGVNTDGCGPASMRLRPSLYFTNKHADIYLEILSKSLAELS